MLDNAEEGFDALLTGAGADDYEYMLAYLNRKNCSSEFIFITEFDIISDGTHPLIVTPLEGTRQTDGRIVTALVDDIYKQNSGSNRLGDHEYRKAVLDTENLTLSYEKTLTRDENCVERTVLEAVILPDGTILFQYFYVGNPHSGSVPASAVFKHINGGSYTAVLADIDPNYDFTYDSIIGKGDITSEQMARNYNVRSLWTDYIRFN